MNNNKTVLPNVNVDRDPGDGARVRIESGLSPSGTYVEPLTLANISYPVDTLLFIFMVGSIGLWWTVCQAFNIGIGINKQLGDKVSNKQGSLDKTQNLISKR